MSTVGPLHIAARLRELADEMTDVAALMDYYGGLSAMGQHGRDLAGAAMIARSWADGIEAEALERRT